VLGRAFAAAELPQVVAAVLHSHELRVLTC
jgi:hypothetical protein